MPSVALACLCEKVLQEKDDVMTLVRVVDSFTITSESLPEGLDRGVELTAVVGVKSVDFSGQGNMTLVLLYPSGRNRELEGSWPFVLEGGAHGGNLVARLRLGASELGLYHLVVRWNGEPLVNIPFMLKAQGEQPGREIPTVTPAPADAS